jgi:hypothetical protein
VCVCVCLCVRVRACVRACVCGGKGGGAKGGAAPSPRNSPGNSPKGGGAKGGGVLSPGGGVTRQTTRAVGCWDVVGGSGGSPLGLFPHGKSPIFQRAAKVSNGFVCRPSGCAPRKRTCALPDGRCRVVV